MRSVFKKLLVLGSLFFFQVGNAQPKSSQTNVSGFKLFFEKLYLHTDKQFYLSGENIWFKAYLVNPRSNQPTYTSNSLYVDLLNSDGDPVDQEMIRLDQGWAMEILNFPTPFRRDSIS